LGILLYVALVDHSHGYTHKYHIFFIFIFFYIKICYSFFFSKSLILKEIFYGAWRNPVKIFCSRFQLKILIKGRLVLFSYGQILNSVRALSTKARTVEICIAARPAAESPSCPRAPACRILGRCLAANRVGITVTTTTRLHCRPPRCLIDFPHEASVQDPHQIFPTTSRSTLWHQFPHFSHTASGEASLSLPCIALDE
jgi:hypothetical protein